jgi:hypothetical protein
MTRRTEMPPNLRLFAAAIAERLPSPEAVYVMDVCRADGAFCFIVRLDSAWQPTVSPIRLATSERI